MDPDKKPPTPPVEPETTPEADAAAMKAIEELESEEETDTTDQPTPAAKTMDPIKPVTPVPPSSDEGEAKDTAPDTHDDTLKNPVDRADSDNPPIASDAQKQEPTQKSDFQPFANPNKKSKKSIIVLVVLVVVLVLGVVGYFVWQNQQGTQQSAPTTSEPPAEETAPAPVADTEASINEMINSIESDLDSATDDEFSDSTLSDTTLYE